MKKVFSLFCLLVLAMTNSFAANKASHPNILFILADDTGIDDYGCYGSDRFKSLTPNIDALAKSGVKFERCYSAPLCGPSRCELITGRYGFRTGGMDNQAAHNPSSKVESSIARTLKQAGYVTGMAGKWRQMGESPGDWGFDEFITDNTAGGWYWKPNYNKNGKIIQEDKDVYCPDVNLEFTLDFLRRHKSEPFFFYFPTHLAHAPILHTPDTKPGTAGEVALYNDNIAYIDKQVGLLIAELEKLGLRENTLIIFSGDNGTAKRSNTIGGREINGHKGTMMEGGARVPLIATGAGVTLKGKSLNDLVDFSDVFPTLVEASGAKMPEGVKFDGRSFAPRVRGEKGNPREWIYVQLGARWYVRNDGWKLTKSGELFDMSDSPFVEKPVTTESDAAKAARKNLQAALDELSPASGKQPGTNSTPPPRRRAARRAAAANQ
jgi:arylsulfatase A